MPPRVTDWNLALAVWIAFATGVISLVMGRTEQWLIFAAHGAVGLWLAVLSVQKIRRVWLRLLARTWDRWTMLGAAATALVVGAVGTGVWWTLGGELVVLGYNLLNWHIIAGLLLVVFVSLHMFARAKPLRGRDVAGRRAALRSGGMVLLGAALWPLQQGLGRAAHVVERRFTGSREANSYAGNAFPTTSWVADNPQVIESLQWQLTVNGAVDHSFTLAYPDLARDDELEATLDCTGGFFSTQIWRGTTVGRLLDAAGAQQTARFVSFVSVTGYRWSLPIDEARTALLATHVGGEPLSHAHGAPVRLVAPGQRGFIWVKWVARVEVRTERDIGELLAIYTSSL